VALGSLAPVARQVFLDANGSPLAFGYLYSWVSGTASATPLYTDALMAVPHPNPARFDAAGEITLYMPAIAMKWEVRDALGVSQWTVDPVSSTDLGTGGTVEVAGTAGEALGAAKAVYLSDGSGAKAAGQWFLADSSLAYSSSGAMAIGMTTAAIGSGNTGTIRLRGQVSGLVGLTVGATYYIGTAGAITATTAGLVNLRVIGIADSTTTLILGDVPSAPIVQTTTVTGAQADFALTANASLLRLNNATLVTLSGFAAGTDGQRLTIESVGAGQVDLLPQSGLSLIGNRLVNFATIGTTSLAAGSGRAVYVYDQTMARWVLIHHEQGAWITPAYVAGNFTASAGTWTVDAGDITSLRYRLAGRTLQVEWYLATTSVSATPTTLKILIPGGFTSAAGARQLGTGMVIDNGGTAAISNSEIAAASTTIDCYKAANASASWAIATNTTTAAGSIVAEVQ
jgi:hypothetical protein